jgi:uncharacterized protein (UPF0147 family)
MNEIYQEIIDVLSQVLEDDLPQQIKLELENILDYFKNFSESQIETSQLIKFQDDLEDISNSPKLDDFSRTELMNVISLIETLYNS